MRHLPHLGTFRLLLIFVVAVAAAFFIRELIAVAGSLASVRDQLRTVAVIVGLALIAFLAVEVGDAMVRAAADHIAAINVCAVLFLLRFFRRHSKGRAFRHRDPHVPLTRDQRLAKLALDRLAVDRLVENWRVLAGL